MVVGWTFSTSILVLCAVLFAGFFAEASDDRREPPKIVDPLVPAKRFFELEDEVTLKCKATGQPKPSYHWVYGKDDDPELPSGDVTFDTTTGDLTIKKLSLKEEGIYKCRAKTTFPNGMSAVAVSPKIEVLVARIGRWVSKEENKTNGNEYQYKGLTCDDQPSYTGPVTYKWYKIVDNQQIELTPDDRLFIDEQGTLHFTYLKRTDANVYACAMSSSKDRQIAIGNRIRLTVEAVNEAKTMKPILKYSTGFRSKSDLTFERNRHGRLECVFSGFTNSGTKVPTITWKSREGIVISGQDQFTVENNGRVLLIKNLMEKNEGPYICTGRVENLRTEAVLHLNVTSPPIWVSPLTSKTVPQGENAEFTCETRKAASDEIDPNEPKWYKNGKPLKSEQNKYLFENEKRKLTVLSAQKDDDIACFQCFVDNSVGEVMSDGCLNVLLPIEITTSPDAEQTIEKGDIVNLTVVATSDPLYALSYKWIFKNVTYEANDVPPHVIYDSNTKVAYINTSSFTDSQLLEIKGTYRRVIFHQFQTRVVDVEVMLKDEPIVVEPIAEAGFDYWIIGLIIGILIIIIVLLIICCVICRRKMLEGDYPVDRKEQHAGLDPEKELKDSGFHDLSRADYDDYPEKKFPPLDFEDIPVLGEGDDESFGSEYGEEATAFNEDGSFIGVYSKNKKSGPPAYQPQATESNV